MIAIAAAFLLQAAAADPAPVPVVRTQVRLVKPGETVELKPGEERFKVVCRREQQPNSRFSKRVCRTPENIERLGDEASTQVNEMSRSAAPVR